MPLVTPTQQTLLPTPPSTERPAEFDSDANSFLGSLPGMQSEANQQALDNNINASYAENRAALAEQKALEALNSANAALASENAASAVTGAGKWSAATSYAEGVTVWSPLTFQTFRKKTPGSASGGADPSANQATWQLIGFNVPDYITQSLGVF